MRLPIRLSPFLLPAILACALWTSRATAQAKGPEFRVNTYTTGTQISPRVASGAGGFAVVWSSLGQDGSGSGVFGQRYDTSGAPLGTEFRVNTYTSNSQYTPSVAGGASGGFVVVWTSFPQGSGYSWIFGQRYSSAGAPAGAEFRVNSYTSADEFGPTVASDSAGNFVVVWRSLDRDGSGTGVFGRRFAGSGTPLGADFQVNTYTTSGQYAPSVASDSAGNFVVVWISFPQNLGTSAVFGQRYASSGVPLGAEFRVNSYTSDDTNVPAVASDAAGDFVVVWRSLLRDGDGYGIFGRRFDSSGSPRGVDFRVNTYTTKGQYMPAVASDANGSFLVTWTSYPQTIPFSSIFGQLYGPAGTPLGSELRVNANTPFDDGVPAVASDAAGHFVVVWRSLIQDGSSNGVFGQRFCPALSSVSIDVIGATTVCTTTKGGIVTVLEAGGGNNLRQWGYRLTTGSPTIFPIAGETGTSYTLDGTNFGGAGSRFLVCTTAPECGSLMVSNEIPVTVNADMTAPVVTPPPALTTSQTLCM